VFSSEPDSCVGRLVECGRALQSCCNRELRYRTDRVRTCVIREPVLKLEDSRSIRCNSGICHTCVRFLEELCIEL
jgi:hypothetical protein